MLNHRKHVYFAQCDFGGPIKIGCTYQVPERVMVLGMDFPFELVLISYIEGSHFHEKFLHAWFREHRIKGEWFQPTPELWRTALEARTTGRIHFMPPSIPRQLKLELPPTDWLSKHYGISEEAHARAMGTSLATLRSLRKNGGAASEKCLAALSALLVKNGYSGDLSELGVAKSAFAKAA